ncbi:MULTISPECIES: glycogen synthase [Pseudoalteromonas]|uniref:starch synthase n=1 Tax=Pseudoalteromonas obscura TaxID=3048491 RepID=A0ABT7EQR6_9GAMM|nr:MULTISPECIES: glycogen/starch synthase [Pseudoalteromonas]MBQ4835086.1 glycogen/starch synthase [Pseudoalteromonas luteoviolacea]MDK2597379.1 glycogen/starch synthase [Pseudoalteromonas sp. P94(2023)]
MHVVMVAAENDKLPNCKVGGVADVIRDVPYALSRININTSVIVPDYGQAAMDRQFVADIAVPFKQHLETAVLWQVEKSGGVTQYVISHSLFSEHGGAIYCNDRDRPFFTDANKFAFFSAAVCEVIEHGFIGDVDVLHLHDWHAACVAVLRQFSPRFNLLKQIRTVFTVHNLALQGVRPFNGDESSLEAWFPTMSYDGQQICDHLYPHCFNPMRAAINLVDKVHLVSPTYREEVQKSSDHQAGFFGGEGLEHDMQIAASQNKLFGILNGCEYEHTPIEPSWDDLMNSAEANVFNWMAKTSELKSVYYIAHQRILAWRNNPCSGPLVTSIGRLTDQKVLLLKQMIGSEMALDRIARSLHDQQGRIIILGSGDHELEYLFSQVMARNENVLYLNGYGHDVGDLMYELGDLFLMPSSFEPCGISQMLAMRAGQPCLVNAVGGLADTVSDNESGFVFCGENIQQQVDNLVNRFKACVDVFIHHRDEYNRIATCASQRRFTWDQSAIQYKENLYE